MNFELCPMYSREALSTPVNVMNDCSTSGEVGMDHATPTPYDNIFSDDKLLVVSPQRINFEYLNSCAQTKNVDGSPPQASVGLNPLRVACIYKEGLKPLPLHSDSLPATRVFGSPIQGTDPIIRQNHIISHVWPDVTDQARLQHPDFARDYCDIKKAGLPNFLGARIPVSSGLNVHAWRSELSEYHDKEIVNYIEFGWPVGYHSDKPPVTTYENHQSARSHQADVETFIATELEFGAILGPFTLPPFSPWMRTSPIMTRPKKDSSLRRVIVDLSYPSGEGVNAGIDIQDYFGRDISYTLPTVGDLVAQLQHLGRGALVWKADLARAYRQLRIDPIDTPLLSIKVGQHYYIDLCPPFGCKTSSAACQRVSNALIYILAKKGFSVLAYLDDYAATEPDMERAMDSYNCFKATTKSLGLELAGHKCVPPTTKLEWLGYQN